MRKTLLPVAVLSLAGCPVFAETFPVGFGYSGSLNVGRSEFMNYPVDYHNLKVVLSYGFALNDSLSVGAAYRYEARDIASISAELLGESFFYWAYVAGDFGTLSVGRVATPSSDFTNTNDVGNHPPMNYGESYAAMVGGNDASFASLQYLYRNYDYIGVRYDGTFGKTDVAIAYFDANGTDDTKVVNAAVRSKIGENNRVYVTYEKVDEAYDTTAWSLGSETDFSFGTLGLSAKQGHRLTTETVVLTDAYFDFHVLDRVTITPEYTQLSTVGIESIDWMSIKVKYDLPIKGASVFASYAEKVGPMSATTAFGLSYKF